MTPKYIIRYSKAYDSKFNSPEVSKEELKTHLKEYQKELDKYKEKILKAIAKITSLKWKDNLIIIYPVLSGRSFSNPVTIKIYSKKEKTFISKEYFIDKIVHELIHNIFVQNEKEAYSAFKKVLSKHSKESFQTKAHIIVHAVHREIYLKMFNEKRLEEDIKRSKKPGVEDYAKAWKIVNKEGSDKIMKRFRKVLKE